MVHPQHDTVTTDERVQPLGAFVLGGNILGWTVPSERVGALLEAFVEGGGLAVDVSDNYTQAAPGGAPGTAERAVGRWIAEGGNRDCIHLTSKVGMSRERPGVGRDNVLRAFDDSLARLRTDHLDVYYAHRDFPDTDLLDTLTAFHEIAAQGGTRAIGFSHITPARLAEAQQLVELHGLTPVTHLQHGYSIVNRQAFEEGYAHLDGIRFLGFHSIESGYLTGKYHGAPELHTEHTDKIRGFLDDPRSPGLQQRLHDVAAKHDAPVSAVALAWFRTRPFEIVPIASARDERQLAELLRAQSVTLDEDDVQKLVW